MQGKDVSLLRRSEHWLKSSLAMMRPVTYRCNSLEKPRNSESSVDLEANLQLCPVRADVLRIRTLLNEKPWVLRFVAGYSDILDGKCRLRRLNKGDLYYAWSIRNSMLYFPSVWIWYKGIESPCSVDLLWNKESVREMKWLACHNFSVGSYSLTAQCIIHYKSDESSWEAESGATIAEMRKRIL